MYVGILEPASASPSLTLQLRLLAGKARPTGLQKNKREGRKKIQFTYGYKLLRRSKTTWRTLAGSTQVTRRDDFKKKKKAARNFLKSTEIEQLKGGAAATRVLRQDALFSKSALNSAPKSVYHSKNRQNRTSRRTVCPKLPIACGTAQCYSLRAWSMPRQFLR